MATHVEKGSRVQFSARWLKSMVRSTNEVSSFKGTVSAIKTYGNTSASTLLTLAMVDWDHGETYRVSVKNLHVLGTFEPSDRRLKK